MKRFLGLKSYPGIYFELLFVGFTLVMGMALSTAFLPIFAEELDPSGALVGFVVSAWFLSRIFIELPSGVLSDRLGKRKLLIIGLVLSAGGAFICYITPSIYLLIVGRALWGLGTAIYFIISTELILDLFDSNRRGRAVGTFQGVEFIGSFIGAPIGGFMAGIIGYKMVFLFAVLLILCSSSAAIISKGLRKIGIKPRGRSGLSIKGIFSSLRNWGLTVTCINSFTKMFIFQGIANTVFLIYLNYQLRISVELIGIIMSLRTIGNIIANVTSGYLSDKLGMKPTIIAGITIESICFYLYTLFPFFEALLPVGFFEGFGWGIAFASLTVMMYEVAPIKLKGSAIGMYRTFMDIGGFLGPPFFMFIYSSMGSYITFLSVITILALNIALLLTMRVHKE